MKLRKSYLLTYLPIVRFCWEAERDKEKNCQKKTYLLTYLPCIPFGSQSSDNQEKKLRRENTYLLTYLPYLPFGSEAQGHKVRTNLTSLLTYPVHLYDREHREIEKNEVTKIFPPYLLTHHSFLLGS